MTTSETTEVVLRDGSTALVPVEFSQSFPALAPDEATLELLEANLGDADIQLGNFKRIKVPSGDLNSWMIPTKGKDVAVEYIDCILLVWKPRRSYWINEGEPDGSAPDCHSLDNRHPVAEGLYGRNGELAAQNPTHLCANCPMSQRGSSSKSEQGSACREQRLLFVIQEEKLFPIVINGPRTSITPLNAFMMDLMEDGKKFSQVILRLGLKKATNKSGKKYNVIDPSVVRDLTPEEIAAVDAYQGQIKAMVDTAMRDFTPAGDDGESGISVGEPDA